MSSWLPHFHYWAHVALLVIGLHTIIAKPSLIKKVIGLGIFQTGVFLLFISMAAVEGGAPPIATEGVTLHANPLPHVLILTAIVVSVSTMALGLALIIRIREEWGTSEVDELIEASGD